MTSSSFIGAWKLVSLELRTEDGDVSYPFGQDVKGYIMYNQGGYMSVAFMQANRPPFASKDMRAGTPEEKEAAFESYQSYCGTYEVLDDKVVHHIEVSLYPNWVGVAQERFFHFNGDKLSLSTPPLLMDGIEQTAHLIWQRV